MRIEAHIIAWNEAETIAFTIKHYQTFCESIIVHDNYSDDQTVAISIASGAIVRSFGIKGVLDDKEYLRVKNLCWKGSSADYVVVVDADEILWHPHLWGHIQTEAAKGTTVFRAVGVNIYSNDMPKQSWLELKEGVINTDYSKIAMFSPSIAAINYEYGAHKADPRGHVVLSSNPLFLLHYRNVGGVNRLIDRHAQYRPRLSKVNKAFKLGVHYLQEDQERIKYWNDCNDKKSKVDISWLV